MNIRQTRQWRQATHQIAQAALFRVNRLRIKELPQPLPCFKRTRSYPTSSSVRHR
jgi:hypothetical protein